MTSGSLGAVPFTSTTGLFQGSCITFCCTRQRVARKVFEAGWPQGSLGLCRQLAGHYATGRGEGDTHHQLHVLGQVCHVHDDH